MATQNVVTTEAEQLAARRDLDADTWKPLYRVGGAAALISVVLIPIAIVVFIASPPPSTVIDWFTLFQNNRLVGLLDLDLVMLVSYVLLVPIFLALYVALRQTSESFMAIGTTLGLVGTAVYLTSNPSFSMLALSDQYAAATTDAQRSMVLAAGQMLLTTWQGTAFDVGYVLSGVAGLIIAAVMLRSDLFSKATAYAGILANAVGLGLFVPTIGVFLALVSLVPVVVWDVLVARRLFQLGQGDSQAETRG